MPLQNRVDPFGAIQAVSAKGALMGNRGILHDASKTVIRKHAHQNWVTCALSFNGRKRTLMDDGRYTELFFLDEATAIAAGHRPCAECRRDRYKSFADVWRQIHGQPSEGRALPNEIDRTLHSARISRGGVQITFEADAADLPDGVMFAKEGKAILVWERRHFDWSFDGYRPRDQKTTGLVTVLTPRPTVEVIRAGFGPLVHDTASEGVIR